MSHNFGGLGVSHNNLGIAMLSEPILTNHGLIVGYGHNGSIATVNFPVFPSYNSSYSCSASKQNTEPFDYNSDKIRKLYGFDQLKSKIDQESEKREEREQRDREREEREQRDREREEREQRVREQREREQRVREQREREQRDREQRDREQREREQREREQNHRLPIERKAEA